MPAYRLSDTYSVPPAGLTFITSATASAAGSMSIDGCFTSAYDAYRIEMYGSTSNDTSLKFRMRAASSDDTTSNYYGQNLFINNTATSGSRTSAANTGPLMAPNGAFYLAADFMSPALASATHVIAHGGRTTTVPTSDYTLAVHNVATAFDGLTIYPAAGTITVTVCRVYGYRNG